MCVICLFLLQTIAFMVLPYECDLKQIAILDGYKYCWFITFKNHFTCLSLLNMCFNIEYSCHTITNIIHGRRLSLQLMTN